MKYARLLGVSAEEERMATLLEEVVPSVAIFVPCDRQFHRKRFSSLGDVIDLAMSHEKTYMAMVPPRQSVPKR